MTYDKSFLRKILDLEPSVTTILFSIFVILSLSASEKITFQLCCLMLTLQKIVRKNPPLFQFL